MSFSQRVLRDAGENAGEHPQCGGREGEGCGARPVWRGDATAPQDITPGETPRAKPRSLEGGQRREHSSEGLGRLRPLPREQHSGFWNGSCLKDGEKINRTCQQGRRMWGGFERVRRSWEWSQKESPFFEVHLMSGRQSSQVGDRPEFRSCSLTLASTGSCPFLSLWFLFSVYSQHCSRPL